MKLFIELKRRNVLRMAALYVVAAWLIMQVAEVIITLAELPGWSGQLVLTVLAVGFPIALVFSWFYELTPEGISLEKEVDRAESITHVTGRRMDFVVIAMLCAALLLFAHDKWWIGPPPERSIAVLPFENLSADPEQEYLSDGISEELLNSLAQVRELRVISRSSSFSFKGKDIPIPEIATQLNVAHVLEGSVRRDGDRVRITAQLIDASSDSHLWSKSYDRELDNVFAVQSEIAEAISDALELKLVRAPGSVAPPIVKKPANTEAHDAYLRGRYLMAHRTVEGAAREFEKAISLDPNYAPAHAALAVASIFMTRVDHGGDLTVTEAVARAASHVMRAMALDPNLASAHAAAGWVSFSRQGFNEQTLGHFERAIEINPNYSIVHSWMAMNYDWVGRYGESFAAQETALRTNPVSITAISNYATKLIARNRLDDAERELEKLDSLAPIVATRLRGVLTSGGGRWTNLVLGDLDSLSLNPEDEYTKFWLNRHFVYIGLEEESLAISPSHTGPREPNIPATLVLLGRPEDAVRALETHLAEDPNFFFRGILGLTLASAGDYGRARPILEESWQWSGGTVTANGVFSVYSAAALIAIYRQAGEDAKVRELLAAMEDNVRRYREAGIAPMGHSPYFLFYSVDYEEGLAAYLAGERERGLSLISKAAEDGFFVPTKEAYLQTLYDDPGFAPILAAQEARQKREREKFLNVVCNDNPYADVWQPLSETCEGVVEQ